MAGRVEVGLDKRVRDEALRERRTWRGAIEECSRGCSKIARWGRSSSPALKPGNTQFVALCIPRNRSSMRVRQLPGNPETLRRIRLHGGSVHTSSRRPGDARIQTIAGRGASPRRGSAHHGGGRPGDCPGNLCRNLHRGWHGAKDDDGPIAPSRTGQFQPDWAGYECSGSRRVNSACRARCYAAIHCFGNFGGRTP